MNIKKEIAGIMDSQVITRYQMKQGSLQVSILSYGASIQEILMDGVCVTLTPQNFSHLDHNPLYVGSTIGPNAGRISNGELHIDNQFYPLSKNSGSHQLHGGFHNLSFCNWTQVATEEEADFSSITLEAFLGHGVDGYPGNRLFSVCYTLTNTGSLHIKYHASTDQVTYINMTNHTYFNLSGDFTQSIYSHTLQINARHYTCLRQDYIPVQVVPCISSPFDFRTPCTLHDQIKKYPHHSQIEIGNGYNHGFILDHVNKSTPVLTLQDPMSSRQLQVSTDAPCIVVYSGGFIHNQLILKGQLPATPSCAIALECQDIPDTPNFCSKETKLTTPNQPFMRRTVYQFQDFKNPGFNTTT